MNKKNMGFSLSRVAIVLILTVFITSCTPTIAQNNSAPQPNLQPSPTIIYDQMKPAIASAKSALAEQLQLNENEIQLVNIQEVQWPDGCLGIQQPGIMCAMHVVDGYQITLSANDQIFETRSNLDGSQIVVVPDQASSSVPVKTESGGLQIADFSSSISGVDGNPDQQLVVYNVIIHNPNNNTVTLLWLEPVLQDSISGRASDTELRHAVNEVIGPNSQVDIQGQLHLNTSGLTKSDIARLDPFFSGFTVSTDQTIPLPQF